MRGVITTADGSKRGHLVQLRMAICTILLITGTCSESSSMIDEQAMGIARNISSDAWKRLASRKIYFGHQSVGYNIVDGVRELGRLEPNRALNVVETNDPAAMTVPVFAHSSNGVNKQPGTKIVGFEEAIDGRIGDNVDIAFFKFCYVDVTRETDVNRLMNDYVGLMSRLKERHPRTQFVHVTVPLSIVESGPKAWAKRVLGRPLAGAPDNVRRDEFNRLLRASYGGKEPLFDLADLESTLPGGKHATFASDGGAYPRLATEYSDGGSHLNEQGRRWVAANLLKFLAELN